MKKFLGNLIFGVLCAGFGIAAFESIQNYNSRYPFCVTKRGAVYKIDKATLAVVTDQSSGLTGFAPVDPESIRANEKQVSCPAGVPSER